MRVMLRYLMSISYRVMIARIFHIIARRAATITLDTLERMNSLRPGVTELDALTYINEYQARYDLPPIERSTWKQSIRQLAEDDKAGWQSGATWLFDAMFVQELAEYIAKRRVLIQLGQWNTLRPYDLEDMRNLVEVGVYDGEIDHPVFALATDW